ncbi:hypothetical protein [Streptomyces sp. NBC_00557]|uniref:hypothetical protein n=1 Tax=Streptomyces sp. NBC_00557 TaxID=2975776 RepID=UPI002E80DD29|nr:hypothetical protein [Streptomyces sp. NBC_00557]WUC32765.1 hypothetical protein OG956_00245 [Streptomyces sp. NBC_00557]
MDFDGYQVTAVRRWVPIPGVRARRIRLPEVISTDLPSMGGEDELRQLYLYLRGGRFIGVGHYVGVRKKASWFVVHEAIRQAIRARELHALRSTVGLGPWSEEEWARLEELVPEIAAFSTHAYEDEPRTRPNRVEISHRVGVDAVLSRLRDTSRPYPGPGGSIVLKERDIRDPYVERQEQIKGRGEAWAALIDCLQNGIEVTATTQWAEQVNAILDSVRQGDKR